MSSPRTSTGVRYAERVRAGDGDPRVVDAPHPGHDRAVVEPDHELGAHRHLAVEPLDDADDVGRLAARRHEVDRPHRARVRLEDRLEDQRVVAVAARRAADLVPGREQPAAVIGRAEQRREARARVEAREAAPVDRPVAADERGGLQVADEGVVLDPHRPLLRRRSRLERGAGLALGPASAGLAAASSAWDHRCVPSACAACRSASCRVCCQRLCAPSSARAARALRLTQACACIGQRLPGLGGALRVPRRSALAAGGLRVRGERPEARGLELLRQPPFEHRFGGPVVDRGRLQRLADACATVSDASPPSSSRAAPTSVSSASR